MKNRTISLPKRLKKEIIKFCREYDSLAQPRNIVIPRQPIKTRIVWASDHGVEFYDHEFEYDVDELYNTKTIRDINKKIKNFCKRTNEFGKKHFGEDDWLWFEVLWNYRPESGESYRDLNLEWVDDYNYD